MKQFIYNVRALARREEGQDLVEYAMLVALIALGAVVAVTAAGGKINEIFQAIVSNIPTP